MCAIVNPFSSFIPSVMYLPDGLVNLWTVETTEGVVKTECVAEYDQNEGKVINFFPLLFSR